MKLVFDIGYNRGEFCTECIRSYPDCKIIAVEANRALAQTPPLFKNVTIINKLASNVAGVPVDFYISPEDGISTASLDYMKNSRFTKGSRYLHEASLWYPPVTVMSTTLEELIKEYGKPDFIKIDVEGHEKEVISGLNEPVSLLGFEWHEEDYESVLETVSHLSNIGFDSFGIVGFFEGDIPSELTFSSAGDPYMDFPKNFYSWDVLQRALEKIIDAERRIHYGMFYASSTQNSHV